MKIEKRFRPVTEQLEDRLLLSTVQFAKDVLSISPSTGELGLGTSTALPLLIDQISPNDFTVKDGSGTTLGPFSDVKDIKVTGGAGNDFITLDVNGLAYSGSFEANTGSGNDTVQVRSSGGAGGSVRGNLSITGGDGNDTIGLGAALSLGGNLSINLGNGADSVTEDAAVAGGMSWQLGNGNDTVTIGNAPGGSLSWNSGNGNDMLTLGDASNVPGVWNVHARFGAGSDTVILAGNGTVATPNQLTGSIDLTGHASAFDPTGSLSAGTWIIVSRFTLQNAGLATIQYASGTLSISPGSGELGLGTSAASPLLISQTALNIFSVRDGAGGAVVLDPVSDIKVTGGTGNDFITLDVNARAYSGSFEANTGSGNDTVQVRSTGGAGSVRGNLSITGGDGNDTIGLGAALSLGGNLSINLGNGADSITEDAAVAGSMSWQLGNGNDTVTIGNAPGGSLSWDSGNGNDMLTLGDASNVPGVWNVHARFGAGSDKVILAGNGTVATPNQLTGSIDLDGPASGNQFDPTGSLAAGTWLIVSRFTLQDSGSATIQYASGAVSISPGNGELALGTSTASPLRITQTALNIFSVRDGAGPNVVLDPVSDIKVTGGAGNDFITLDVNGLAYSGSFEANTGSGNDTVQVRSSGAGGSVRGNLSITGGDGNDTIGLGGLSLGANLSINLGNGADSVTEDAAVAGSMSWQLGNGNDTVTIGNAPGGLLAWNSGNGNDALTLGDASNVPGVWDVHARFGNGSDKVILAGNGTVATPNQLTGSIDLDGPASGNQFDPTGSLAAGTWIIGPNFTLDNG